MPGGSRGSRLSAIYPGVTGKDFKEYDMIKYTH
jgi:hypothetical protein